MITQSQNGYMLLFRGTHWDKDLSPEEIQKMVSQWYAWFERLTQEGKCKAGHPLEREGRIVSGKNGRTVADGPFAESKEAIGGYFLLQVPDMDAAGGIAKKCPLPAYGSPPENWAVGAKGPAMKTGHPPTASPRAQYLAPSLY